MDTIWKNIPIIENNEPLVDISNIHKKIIYDKEYFKAGLPHSIEKCFVRESIADKLISLVNYIGIEYHLLIFDAWRPLKLQIFLFENFKKNNPNLSIDEVSTYISNPYFPTNYPPPHYTGGAIDIAIFRNGKRLEMKDKSDNDFSIISETNYYQKLKRKLSDNEMIYSNNRKFLCEIMYKFGFSNYEKEFWHFDYGNQFWAKKTRNSFAFYGGITPK